MNTLEMFLELTLTETNNSLKTDTCITVISTSVNQSSNYKATMWEWQSCVSFKTVICFCESGNSEKNLKKLQIFLVVVGYRN